MLSLYMSFDAEFNADTEYVHGFWVYFIPKDFWVKNHVFGTFFRFILVFWPNQAGYGKNDMRFGISVIN